MANAAVDILINAVDGASKTLRNIADSASGLEKGFEKLAQAASVVAAAGFAAATYAATKSIQAFADAEYQNTITQKSLENMGISAEEAADAMKIAGDAALAMGFDDEAAGAALAILNRHTKDLNVSQDSLSLAMGLSRVSGLDLESAANKIGLALEGNVKLLKEHGIELDENASKTEILAALDESFGNIAEETADTLKVAWDKWKNTIENLGEELGGEFAPLITEISDRISAWVDSEQFQELKDQIISFVDKATDSISYLIENWDQLTRDFDANTGAITAIKDELTKLWDIIKNDLIPTIIENKDELTSFAKLLGGALLVAILGVIKAIEIVVIVVDKLIEYNEKIDDFFDRFKQGIELLGIALGNVPGQIEEFAAVLGAEFLLIIENAKNWGIQVVTGFISGLSDMAQSLFDKAKYIADTVISTVENALGIRSPSKVMEQIGIYIMEGLSNGISEGEEDFNSKLENIGESFSILKEKGKDAWETFKEAVKDAKGSYDTAIDDIKEKIGSLKDEMSSVKTQFKSDLEEIQDDFNNSYSELSGNFETDVANEILDSEERLAEARTDLAEEQAKAAEDQNADTLADLQATIDIENAFLESHAQDYSIFADAITEARRVASLDTIQLLQEQYATEKDALIAAQYEKEKALHDEKELTLSTLNDEILALRVQKEEEKIILKEALSDARKALKDSYTSIASDTETLVELLKELFGEIPSSIIRSFDTLGKKFKNLFDSANTGGIVTSSGIQHFAAGGVVPGIGTQDTVPAMLTPGEVVLNPARGQFPASSIEVNFNNVNVRNDNDLQTILRAVKDTLTRESQAQKIGAL